MEMEMEMEGGREREKDIVINPPGKGALKCSANG